MSELVDRLVMIKLLDAAGVGQGSPSGVHRWSAAGRPRGGAAGRGGLRHRAGPPAHRRRRPVAGLGARVGCHDRGRARASATSPGSWLAPLFAEVKFAIGAKRIAPLRGLLEGIADADWIDAIGMDGAQVAVAPYAPNWWSAATQMLIRRVRLTRAQISACPRRRRTLHPDQRALPISERAVAVYGYSFIATNLDVSTWTKLPAWSTGTGTAPRSEVAG